MTTCQHCKYWVTKDKEVGECHRLPPRVAGVLEPGRQEDPWTVAQYTYFPVTRNQQGCALFVRESQ